MPVTDAQLEAYEENAALHAVYLDTVESVAKKIIAEMKINSDYGDPDKVFSEYMGHVRGTIKSAKRPILQKIDDAVHNDESVDNAQDAFRSTYKNFTDVKKALKLSTEPALTPDEYETLPPKLQEKYKKTDVPAGKGREGGYQKLVNYPAHIIYRRKNQIGNQSGGRRTRRNRKNKRKTTRRR
jgi:hypothetical protein